MVSKKRTKNLCSVALPFAIACFFMVSQNCASQEKQIEPAQKKTVRKALVSVGEVMPPDSGEHLWIFPKNKDTIGSGGKLQIYMDHESHQHASAGFAKYELGVGGALPEHKHDKTEEIAYFLSGEGIVLTYENKKLVKTSVKEGYVWYTAPGEWHSFKNTGKEPLKLVFAVIPNEKKGLLSFFKKVGAEPGKEATVFSTEEFGKIATEHDLILKPPTKVE